MTSAALQAPHVLVASSGATQSVLAASGASFVEIESEDDLYALKLALEGNDEERNDRLGFEVDTLVIESIDEFSRILLSNYLEKNNRFIPSSDDWQWLSARLNAIFRGLSELELDIIIISHLSQVHESTAVKPNIQGAFANQIHNYVDYAFLLVSQDKTEISDPEIKDGKVSYAETDASFKFLTQPTDVANWLHDDTGTLPRYIELDAFWDTIWRQRAAWRAELPESSVTIVEDPAPEVQVTEPEPAPEKEAETPKDVEVPGMSSNDQIKALLKKNKKS